jgi:hypothetical protein
MSRDVARLRTHAALRGPPFQVVCEPLFLCASALVISKRNLGFRNSRGNGHGDGRGNVQEMVDNGVLRAVERLAHGVLGDTKEAQEAIDRLRFSRFNSGPGAGGSGRNSGQLERAKERQMRAAAGGLVATRCGLAELRRDIQEVITNAAPSPSSPGGDFSGPGPAAIAELGLSADALRCVLEASRDLPLFPCGHGKEASGKGGIGTGLVSSDACLAACIDFAEGQQRGLLLGVHSPSMWRLLSSRAPQCGALCVDRRHSDKLRLVTMRPLAEARDRTHLFLLVTQMRQQYQLRAQVKKAGDGSDGGDAEEGDSGGELRDGDGKLEAASGGVLASSASASAVASASASRKAGVTPSGEVLLTDKAIARRLDATLRPDEVAMLRALRAEQAAERKLLHPPRPRKLDKKEKMLAKQAKAVEQARAVREKRARLASLSSDTADGSRPAKRARVDGGADVHSSGEKAPKKKRRRVRVHRRAARKQAQLAKTA